MLVSKDHEVWAAARPRLLQSVLLPPEIGFEVIETCDQALKIEQSFGRR